MLHSNGVAAARKPGPTDAVSFRSLPCRETHGSCWVLTCERYTQDSLTTFVYYSQAATKCTSSCSSLCTLPAATFNPVDTNVSVETYYYPYSVINMRSTTTRAHHIKRHSTSVRTMCAIARLCSLAGTAASYPERPGIVGSVRSCETDRTEVLVRCLGRSGGWIPEAKIPIARTYTYMPTLRIGQWGSFRLPR